MRIGILSDCHLGERKFRKITNFQNSYESVNNKVFNEALSILEKEKVDACIIAGDLFDNPNPSIKTILQANKLISFSEKLKDKLYILSGNHDWSQSNDAISCHTFDIFNSEKIECVTNYSEVFTIKENNNDNDSNNDSNSVNNIVTITMLPYKCLTPENYRNIYKNIEQQQINKLKNKKNNIKYNNILVFHGSVDVNKSILEDEDNIFLLPTDIAKNYDLVVAGHVHIPQIISGVKSKILVPGSLMPSNQANDSTMKPSVYIYDTNTNVNINNHENKSNIEVFNLKTSPNVYNISTSNINDILNEISSSKYNDDIYFIKYNGKASDIDEKLYKLACQNVLNINVQTNEIINIEDYISNNKINDIIKDFWKYVETNHEDYVDEFKNILKGDS